MLHITTFQIINIYSCSSQNRATGLLYHWPLKGGVNQMCILTNSIDMLEYTQPSYFSSRSSTNTYDFTILYKTISHAKLKRRIERIGPTVFHQRIIAKVDTNALS